MKSYRKEGEAEKKCEMAKKKVFETSMSTYLEKERLTRVLLAQPAPLSYLTATAAATAAKPPLNQFSPIFFYDS